MANSFTEKNRKILLSSFITAFYFLLLVYVVRFHELWRDEAEVWLFARDGSLSYLLPYARNTGHPLLWHIILIPFAKVGFPYTTITALHCIIASLSVFIVIYYSPVNLFLKLLFCFGYFLFFEYGVIARNYSIGILFSFFVLAFYKQRFSRSILYGILLFLLYNTNAYSAILASGFSFIYLLEYFFLKNKKASHAFAICLMILGGLLFIYQVYPEEGTQKAAFFNWVRFPESLLISFFPENPHLPLFTSYWKLYVSLFIISFAGRLFAKYWQVNIFFIYSIACLILFFVFVYMNGPRHAGFLLVTIICGYWLYLIYDERKSDLTNTISAIERLFQIVFTLSLIFSLYFGIGQAKKDIEYNYSNAKEMAGFMKNSGYDSEEIFLIAHSPDYCKTVLYYLEYTKNMYYPAEDRIGSYMFWTQDFQRAITLPREQVLGKIEKVKKPKGKTAIALLDFPIESKNPDPLVHFSLPGINLFHHPGFIPIQGYEKFQFLFKTSGSNEFIKEEQFYLYRVLLDE